ncbi:hypothetical protein BIV60_01015 [Bacillus sp. MUM 116]|nr:hypothetical protein BIV60_01015 [Bacillus sp. MUM 116]
MLLYHRTLEKRKRLDQPRQAQNKPAERLFFNLLDGLSCDLEGLGAGAGQLSKPKFILSYLQKKTEVKRGEVFTSVI